VLFLGVLDIRESGVAAIDRMQIEAYIRIVGSEATVRAIHSEINVPETRIKETKAPIGAVAGERWWNWMTSRVPVDPDDEDGGLRALLQKYRPFFSTIRAHSEDTDVYLEVITKYESNEAPRGLFLSAETVSLLSELGAAVDNDVYR
jgi:hypothetical protein